MGISCSSLQVNSKASSKHSVPQIKNELNIYYSNSDEINDGLFDFDDAKCLFKEQKIDTLGFTSQKTMNFGLKTPNDKCEQETETDNGVTLTISYEANKYTVTPSHQPQSLKNEEFNKNSLWRVIRKHSINEYDRVQLETHDILRLGKLYFHVREIYMPDKPFLPIFKKRPSIVTQNESSDCCRICLSKTFSNDDPLISPCKCKGTMKCVHFKCLQRWVKEKVEPSVDDVVEIYSWKEIKCELCKTNLQLNYLLENKWTHLLQVEQKKKPYIVFETLFPDEQQKMYVFTIFVEEEKEIIIGRYLDCDIRINDITVSRFHARLNMFNKKIYMEDLESKFGTLIMVQKPLTFSNKEVLNMSFQCRNSLIRLSRKC